MGGRLAAAAKEDGFTGARGRTILLHAPDAPFRRVLLVGIGRDTSPEAIRRFAATVLRRARDVRASRVALASHSGAATADPAPEERVRAAVEGAGLSAYQFTRYRQSETPGNTTEVVLLVRDGEETAVATAAHAAEVAVDATCRARDLVNEPPNVLTPSALADAAREIAHQTGLGITIMDLEEARTMGMGLFAAVAAGSAEPPKFIVLDYRPEGPDARDRTGAGRTVALVGKGITFDSGGLDVKTASGMRNMKSDMAGAAAVLGAMGALRDLGVPVRVLGVAPATENMASLRPMRPGDIIRALSGKTVEITNTDAEGRLVLADALAYAVREGADEIIDLATLTGACVVALGNRTAGLMSNDQALADRLLRAAALAGEQLWQLPLSDEFAEVVQGEISDLRNQTGREGGAQRAAAFLREFVGAIRWAHLDIAGPAWSDDKAGAPYLPQGGTGYGVRTLLRYLAAPM
jgi:leucyl aminopeptidase